MISTMPQAEGKPVRVPIAFPPEMYEWLRETAFRRRAKMAELVREAIEEYRARHEPQLRLPIERGKDE
jgi:predicted DNA-binding protein